MTVHLNPSFTCPAGTLIVMGQIMFCYIIFNWQGLAIRWNFCLPPSLLFKVDALALRSNDGFIVVLKKSPARPSVSVKLFFFLTSTVGIPSRRRSNEDVCERGGTPAVSCLVYLLKVTRALLEIWCRAGDEIRSPYRYSVHLPSAP